MHVAVCIVSYRSAEDVAACVRALAKSRHADFEVVVCENGGPAASAALLASLPAALPGGQPLRVVDAGGNLGFAGGVNTCIRETLDADAWWVLNPDTEPTPEALATLAARLGVGDCDAVGGILHFPDGRVQALGGLWRRWLARAVSLGHGLPLGEAAGVERATVEGRQNYLSGASMLVNRRFWDIAGPMREDYFLYCEEVEWCLRARARGLGFGFAPGALVLHRQGTSTGAAIDFRRQGKTPVFLNERNRLLLTRDCFPYLLPVAACFALLLIFMRFGRRGAFRQVGYALEGWVAGLMNRRGKPNWLAA
jgi:N-acetylglucosaminyl-diphospho-decaprenol L-rhamnosyltransferase